MNFFNWFKRKKSSGDIKFVEEVAKLEKTEEEKKNDVLNKLAVISNKFDDHASKILVDSSYNRFYGDDNGRYDMVIFYKKCSDDVDEVMRKINA